VLLSAQKTHTHTPRNDTDIAQRLGISTAMRSKQNDLNKTMSKPAKIRRK